MMESAVTFAVVLVALLVAHDVADHWIQTNHQAQHKGLPGWPGRLACARHVATYTATTAALVASVWHLFSLPIAPLGFVLGQMVSAVTHYWVDRRFTLQWLANLLERSAGKGTFYQFGAPRDVFANNEAFAPVQLYRFTPGGARGDEVKWDNPSLGTGAYALDQSWHRSWLFVAALLTALV